MGTTLVLPALAEENDILGREPGEALWRERFDEKALQSIKAMDERQFQALFQNNPRGSDDILFRREDFKIIDDEIEYLKIYNRLPGDNWFWTFDLATSEKETADYTVWARWLYYEDHLYCMDIRRVRMEFPQLKEEIMELMWLHPDDKFCFPRHSVELFDYAITPAGSRGQIESSTCISQAIKKNGLRLLRIWSRRDGSRCWQIQNTLSNLLKNIVISRKHDLTTRFDCSSVATHHLGLQSEFEATIRREEKPLSNEDVRAIWQL